MLKWQMSDTIKLEQCYVVDNLDVIGEQIRYWLSNEPSPLDEPA